MKHFIQMDIFKFVPKLEKINFIETHENKQKQKSKEQIKTETKKEEKPVEQKALS